MIDLIIFLALVLIFAAGFWCGKKFGTFKNMWAQLIDWLSKLF